MFKMMSLLCIKTEHFDIKYMHLKYYGDNTININYKSPSVFLNGLYFILPINNTNSKHIVMPSNNHYLIIKNTHESINKLLIILYNINNHIAYDIANKFNSQCDINNGIIRNKSYIAQLWNNSGVDDIEIPSILSNSSIYAGFIESYDEYWILKIENYYLTDNSDNIAIYMVDMIKRNGIYNPIINVDYQNIIQSK